MSEGYIKYNTICIGNEYPEATNIVDLQVLRNELKIKNLIGMLPGGIGYGNVSKRWNDKFIVSGSQTGGEAILSCSDYSIIHDYDILQNTLVYSGLRLPSSETITHLAIYSAKPKTKFVAHLHNKEIWEKLIKDGFKTNGFSEYGTVEIALEAKDYVSGLSDDEGIFALSGHEDGVIAFSDELKSIIVLINKHIK
ncbi:MAG: class II aldolase/adducin family protein [Bacteroidota bacterium]